MSADIVLDDWSVPVPIDVRGNNQMMYDIDEKELDRNIQQNREVVKRIRNNKKYEKILQEV